MHSSENLTSAQLPTPNTALSVSELLARAKAALERALPLCWVSGEISGFKRAASGHCYFDLKDDAAQIACVLYRNRAALVGFELKDGAQVELRVRPAIYEPRGSLQFAVEQARLAGVGRLFEAFLLLKAKLQAEGLFDDELKRPLPAFPRCIGLITSLKAAALADMLRVLRDRWPRAVVIVYPASVQGVNSPSDLLAALHQANTRAECDVLVIGRGGGSVEDLWAFNDEALTRAVAASLLPIVSAVGHETDFSLCDYAADARAPTPTAAAVMITPERDAMISLCANYDERIRDFLRRRLDRYGERLDRASERLRSSSALIAPWRERLLRLDARLKRTMAAMVPVRHARLARVHQRLALRVHAPQASMARVARLDTRLTNALADRLTEQQQRLAHAAQALALLNPQHVLDRGYAVVFDDAGRSVSDASSLAVDASIRVKLRGGEVRARVTDRTEDAVVSKGA
jgi:exodeoxyribonuclease VII large subunit